GGSVCSPRRAGQRSTVPPGIRGRVRRPSPGSRGESRIFAKRRSSLDRAAPRRHGPRALGAVPAPLRSGRGRVPVGGRGRGSEGSCPWSFGERSTKSFPCSRELASRSPRVDPEQSGDLLVGVPLEVVEDDRGPKARRQRV